MTDQENREQYLSKNQLLPIIVFQTAPDIVSFVSLCYQYIALYSNVMYARVFKKGQQMIYMIKTLCQLLRLMSKEAEQF